MPALQPPCPSTSSRLRILKEESGVEPGWVEIIPLKRVTVQVRTWLLSPHTDDGRKKKEKKKDVISTQQEQVELKCL